VIYGIYQAQRDATAMVREFARFGSDAIWREGSLANHPAALGLRYFGALCDQIAGAGVTHAHPGFHIDIVRVGNRDVPVIEEVADETPFYRLLRFRKDTDAPMPKVLLVAPMSGHFATLLRGTVQVLLADHDVYITDWRNARDIPLAAGEFGFDGFVDHVIRGLRALGPRAHVIAVCQPTVAVLAAVAVMAEAGDPATPRSMTLMAGPIDTRINPTRVNVLAKSRPYSWFEKNVIATVPWRYHGARRRVYPGFLQLMAFVSMNMDRHIGAHLTQFRNLVGGRTDAAETHRNFYDEYNAVMDLPAEFYLETIKRVFQDHDLPNGTLTWHGEKVRPEAIRRTAILTVEGENDDICAIGQTVAAQDICARVRPAMKRHHLQTGVGHYGVFNGRRWRNEIYPLIREMVQATS
jgi:poly(3-hydroxybutyrate) depolymerase